MQKITKANRKFFLKWLPFNFCDRHCKRCEEFQSDCKIYQDEVQFKAQCMMEGKDPYDMKVVFEHVGKMMAETMAMVEADLKKRGVKLTKKDRYEYDKKQEKEDKIVKNHPLYKQCRSLSSNMHKFLTNFNPALPVETLAINSIKKELEDISLYSHMILVKAARALHSQIDDLDEKIKFSRPDYLVSATLSYYSLLTVEKALENLELFIRKSEPVWAWKINSVVNDINRTKKVFKKYFPEVEKFRNKVIFHGDC